MWWSESMTSARNSSITKKSTFVGCMYRCIKLAIVHDVAEGEARQSVHDQLSNMRSALRDNCDWLLLLTHEIQRLREPAS